MKKILLPVFMLFAALTVYAQTQKAPPQYINYQAIVRDKEGKILANKKVTVEFQILKYNGFSFDTERAETHTLNTTDLGLINLNIGKGSSMNGLPFKAISAIDWADSLRLGVTIIDGNTGQRIIEPTSQSFASTPYTLLAQNSLKADIAKVALQSLGDTLWKKNGDTAIYRLNGKVGIGIQNPTSALEVFNSITMSSKVANKWPALIFNNHNNQTKYFEMAPSGEFYLYDITSRNYDMFWDNNGRVGLGTLTPTAKLTVNGTTLTEGLRLNGSDFQMGLNDGRSVGNIPHQRALVHDVNDVLVLNYAGDFEGGIRIDGNAKITGGLNTGGLLVDLQNNRGPGGRDGLSIYSSADNNVSSIITNKDAFYFYSTKRGGDANIQAGEGSFSVVVVRGADIIEKFQSKETLEEGILVTIDETDIQNYKTTSKAYQKGIVGIVSGANGVKHGMLLEQDDVLAGNTKVAIAGRVYVKATAQNGAIKAGDLLTSSNKAGYAMKVTSRKKAFGSVVGKALTSLETGEGFVLVLVGLQ